MSVPPEGAGGAAYLEEHGPAAGRRPPPLPAAGSVRPGHRPPGRPGAAGRGRRGAGLAGRRDGPGRDRRRAGGAPVAAVPAAAGPAGGAALAAQTPYWAYVWPRDAGFTAAALATTGHRREAGAVLGFLAGTQRDDGTWPAAPPRRPAGRRRPPGPAGRHRLGPVGGLAGHRPGPRPAAGGPAVADGAAAADHAAAAVGPDGLPPAPTTGSGASAPTLGTAAALLAGLRAATHLAGPEEAGRRDAWARAAEALRQGVAAWFGPGGYQRHPSGGGPDAAVTWLEPPFGPSDPAVARAVRAAWRRLTVAGGAVPGRPWLGDPWTPATASFALAAMASGDVAAAEPGWPGCSATGRRLAAFPERVGRGDGAPARSRPWPGPALVLLTLVSRDRAVPTPDLRDGLRAGAGAGAGAGGGRGRAGAR